MAGTMDINEDLAKEYALVTSFMLQIQEKGTISQMFDECYELAKEFVKEYPLDTNWEETLYDYDEYILGFIKKHRPLWI